MIKNIIAVILLACISCSSFAQRYHTKWDKNNFYKKNSQVYIYREHGLTGCLVTYKTYIDGQYIGKIGMRGYLLTSITPGHHIVTVEVRENTLRTDLFVQPSRAYYFKVAQNVNYTSKDAAVSVAGAVVGGTTGVGFFSPGKIASQITLVDTKRI